MMRRYGLRDEQWEQSTHGLPGREETVGVTVKDTGSLSRRCTIGTAPVFPGGIFRNASGLGIICPAAIAAGRQTGCGARCANILPPRRITHTPCLIPRSSMPTNPRAPASHHQAGHSGGSREGNRLLVSTDAVRCSCEASMACAAP
jgi:hypothetical protein